MNSFTFNKAFAAVLIAGIVAMLSGFISENLVSPKALAQDAVPVEAAEGGGGAGGPAKTAGPEPVLRLLASADVTKGEKISKACAACHSFDNGGADKVGPNLWSLVGRDKGKKAGFSYSAGMEKAGGQWDYNALNHFLYKPKDFVSGTKMTFAGLKKTEDRAALIAWLRTLSPSPAPLPGEADIAKEAAELAPPPPATEAEKPAEEDKSGDAPAPAESSTPETKDKKAPQH